MSSPRYRNDIRHERIIVRLRRIDRNLYRLTAAIRAVPSAGLNRQEREDLARFILRIKMPRRTHF